MDWISIIISVVALIVSSCVAMWGWWRHRNIYAIEFFYCRSRQDNPEVKEKLNSGKYTVLSSNYDSGVRRFIVVLGRIKK